MCGVCDVVVYVMNLCGRVLVNLQFRLGNGNGLTKYHKLRNLSLEHSSCMKMQ